MIGQKHQLKMIDALDDDGNLNEHGFMQEKTDLM
jgi:valyl-tRNA synthetase